MSLRTTRRTFMKQSGTLGLSAATFAILSRRATAEASRKPNILLFFPDQHRPDWSSLNTSLPVRTPNFERLARTGTQFTQAICPAPVCAPSRACLALGKNYDRTGVPSNSENVADGAVTFYSRLRDAGYRVGGVGKFDLRKGASDWGLDGRHIVNGHNYFEEWGFTDGIDSEGKNASLQKIVNRDDPAKARGESPYNKYLTDRNDGSLQRYLEWNRRQKAHKPNGYAFTEPVDLADEAYNDNWVGRNGLGLIESFPTNQPWFLQANFPGPHPPMDITFSMADWYRGTAFPEPHRNDELSPETHTEIRRNYSAMVENIDRWLGRYLEAIEKRGELENTIVIWSSDHGEMLGDHNLWGKSVPYHPSLSVPLLVSGPGVRQGHRQAGPTTTLDLTATFLDYAGAAPLADADSQTLRPVLEGKTDTGRSHVVSGLHNWRLAFDGRYKLIRGYDGSKGIDKAYQPEGDAPLLLFDHQADPLEDHNLAAERPEEVERLTKLLPLATLKKV